MKNSKEYSKKVGRLYRSLKRKYPKVKKVTYDEPVDSLIYAIVSERMKENATQSAVKKFADYFVDLNELRVSRIEEIVEVLAVEKSIAKDIAMTLTNALGSVFGKYNTVSLIALKKIGKRPAKQVLEEMEGVSRFVVDYCMLTSLQGHAIPLTEKMIDYLKGEELVHPDADEQEIEGFLTRQVSAQKAYEFYALLRRHSELSKTKKKKKVKTVSKTKKKVKKAVKTKKTTKKKKVTKAKKITKKKKATKKKKTTKTKKRKK
ncbi:MAG: hypothetical protein KAS75_03755 [Planctomycetes bacterium]|nr:hypothetical protein [Planctomycetota bacterium]